jgi:hypothetical protein
MVVVNVNLNGVKQFQRSLGRTHSEVNKKCQQALNRTLQRSRTQMTNGVGEKLNLRKKTIRDLVSIQRATKATGLIGKLSVKNKLVPLMEYSAKQNRKGVSFKVFHDRPRQLIKHAFIYPDSRSRLTVFKREPGAGRLKIKPLYGTTIADKANDLIRAIGIKSKQFFSKELIRLMSLRKNVKISDVID